MFFNINEHFHFNAANENLNRVSNGEMTYEIRGIETVLVSTEKERVVILTRDGETGDILYCFSMNGHLVFKVGPPEHYRFWYLEGLNSIACDASDSDGEKSPLSGWRFSINLDTGEMIKGTPVY